MQGSRGVKAKMPMRSGVGIYELLNFCDRASLDLKEVGEEDAAFYFEQFADYLRTDYNPGKGLGKPSKVLGM